MSTTFRYPNSPSALVPFEKPTADSPPLPFVYSRLSAPTSTRLEATLSALLNGPTLVYPSGLSAFHALLVHVNPKRLLMTGGYHGCHDTAAIISRLTGMEVVPLSTPPRAGDLVHVETPLNPDGTASDISYYASLAHSAGALLSVDATFAPPPLQDPFRHGADFVMHSGSKYFGGHSDMLAGTLSVRTAEAALTLVGERMYLGATMGSMEAWLGVRSIKTLELRVVRAGANATALVKWIDSEMRKEGSVIANTVKLVTHASLQDEPWLKEQMPNGFGPVFSLVMKSEEMAKSLPSKLVLWAHATSLGGVESLIEWRAMSDTGCDRALLRLSVGIENVDDLKADLLRGFEAVAAL